MKRCVISFFGALVALGFLGASATANYLFGASLGHSEWEAEFYGAVGVLAVAMNALAPFYLSWSLTARRYATTVGIALLWMLCVTYSTTSALGFATQNREATALTQKISQDTYDDTRSEITDLKQRRQDASRKERSRIDAMIDDARKRLEIARDNNLVPVDAQSQFLSKLSFGTLDPQSVRDVLCALFAVMIEFTATLGLFAALSHSSDKIHPAPSKPETNTPTQSRWTPKAVS